MNLQGTLLKIKLPGGGFHRDAIEELALVAQRTFQWPGFKITYSVTIVTSVPWDTERVLRLVKTHMGKCLFSPELKSYLITQWNCTTIGSCRCRKTNQWVGSGATRNYGDDTRQYSRRNGRGIWLYKRSFRHRILRFTSTEATTESCSYLARQSTQYSFRISGNRGYDSNRVRSLSILHSYCVL